MKAEELRLGNLVYYKITCSITHILKEFVGIETYDDFIQIEHIEPIPLTEEWLLKCGFEQNENSFELRIRGLCFNFYFYPNVVEFYIESVGVDLCFVHQLQNLYFALTGEELTIKL